MSHITVLLSQSPPGIKGTGLLVAMVGVVAGVAKGFEWFDSALSPEGKRRLGQWLKNVPGTEQVDAWASVFPDLIDKVFGPKPLSWIFFLRSCVASLIAIAVLFILGLLHYGERGLLKDMADSGPSFLALVVVSLATALIVNCVPDYLSVIISRFIVRMMAERPTILRTLLYLLLDVLLTLVLALGWNIAVSIWSLSPSAYQSSLKPHPVLYAFHLVKRGVDGLEYYPVMWVFIGASLFTSVWVWLYVLASAAIRIIHKVRFIWLKIVPFLNVEKQPMIAIGRVAGLIAGALYAAGLIGVWLYQRS